MKKRPTMMFASLVLSTGMALAQSNITGTVISNEDGEPVIGASVKVKGSTDKGAITNIDGKFEINVKPGTVLEITYVGMEPQTVKAKPNMHITLDTDKKVLDEVMVIAYGTQKKSAFTGSAAVVDAKEIGKVQVTNAADALKGKAAGVQINNATGQPGSAPSIRIRGFNSINAGNDPLIVVDGSPYAGSLSDIATSDIESMNVLKDAASTALYGARGGNGVVLITTKSGKRGQQGTITVDAKWGSNSKAVPEYETINNPAAYYEMWYKALYNYATNTQQGVTGQDANGNNIIGPLYGNMSAYDGWLWANANLIDNQTYGLGYNVYTIPNGQYLIGQNGKLNPNATLGSLYTRGGTTYYLTPDNWNDAIYNNSLRQEYTVTAQGSTDKGTFYASVNYLDNEGITAASDYKRLTARIKANYQLKPWLTLDANVYYGHYDMNSLGDDGESGGSGNKFAFTNIAPIYPIYMRDANGNIMFNNQAGITSYDYGDGTVSPFRPYISGSNPISDALLNVANSEGNTFNGTGTVTLRLPYGFTVTSINNVFLDEARSTETRNPYFGQYATMNGMVTKGHGRTWSQNYQQRVNWHQVYGKHDIEVMLGHEYYISKAYSLSAAKHNQASIKNTELAGAVILDSGTSSTSEYNTESWLGRAMYNYDMRYFGQASIVRQASSRFDKSSWWGTFWSVGGGWNINKESWFKAKWVDELKLKASYGENGNDNIGSFRYVKYYAISNSNDQVSLAPSSLGNKNISWEKNGKFNVGVDFSLFDGRLYGGIEYYNYMTRDMLSWVSLPPSFGWAGYYDNVGNMKNDGIEIDLHAVPIRTKDFEWTIYLNMTSNHNEITKLSPSYKKNWQEGIGLGYSSGSYFYQEGHSRFTYFAKKYAGVNANGESMWYKNVYETVEGSTTNYVYYDNNGNRVDDSYLGTKHRKVVGQETTTTYSDADQYLCGDVLPDVYGGFGTSLSWKGLDFSIDFQYQLGGQVYDGTYAGLMSASAGSAIHVDMLNAWSADNTSSNIPRWQYGDNYMAAGSDRFLVSASYLTLANITLGYTLPKNWVKTIGLQSVRVYGVADNIWTWSKRQGLDPRQSITGGSSNAYYRPMRTISGGITVTF